MTAVNKIFHANAYVDGTTSLLSRFSEMKLPDLSVAMAEHKGGGMFGTLELPSGLAALTVTVKVSGLYPDLQKFGGNPFATRRIQVRANVETHDADGRIAELPLVCTIGGRWKKLGGLTIKPQENTDLDDEVAVHYIKTVLGGDELYEIDVHANIYRVGGVDLLETMRKNLGV